MMEIRMSEWFTPDNPPPKGPGVVQIKVLGALLDYPDGKSAMLWYGASASIAEAVRSGLAQSAPHVKSTKLRWRYVSVDPPGGVLTVLLDRFVRRFGAPPVANTKAGE